MAEEIGRKGKSDGLIACWLFRSERREKEEKAMVEFVDGTGIWRITRWELDFGRGEW